MYYPNSAACNQPNSADPMSPAEIAAQDAYIAAVGQHFTSGDQALDDLIAQLGGTLPSDAAGDSGVPTVGTGPLVTNPDLPGTPGASGVSWIIAVPPSGIRPTSSGNPGAAPPRGGYSGWRRLKAQRGGGGQVRMGCPNPKVVPLVSGLFPGASFPAPVSAPAPPPLMRQPSPQPVAVAPPAAPPPPPPSQASCRTGNICLDLRNGCVASYQVDPGQMLACAQAGYVGNLNRYPAILAQPNLPFLGSPDLNPPQFQPVGMGDDLLTGGPGSSVFWGSIGVLAFGLWAWHEASKKRRA